MSELSNEALDQARKHFADITNCDDGEERGDAVRHLATTLQERMDDEQRWVARVKELEWRAELARLVLAGDTRALSERLAQGPRGSMPPTAASCERGVHIYTAPYLDRCMRCVRCGRVAPCCPKCGKARLLAGDWGWLLCLGDSRGNGCGHAWSPDRATTSDNEPTPPITPTQPSATDRDEAFAGYLDELEQVCSAATPGPWKVDRLALVVDGGVVALCADAQFVLYARHALPKLVAKVRELQDSTAIAAQRAIALMRMTARVCAGCNTKRTGSHCCDCNSELWENEDGVFCAS